MLVGAVLSPTDPVFAAAIIGRHDVPQRLRCLLNIESGLNDVPAVLVVLIMFDVLDVTQVGIHTVFELVLGVVVGMIVPWIAIRLERLSCFSVATAYEPLYALPSAYWCCLLLHSLMRTSSWLLSLQV